LVNAGVVLTRAQSVVRDGYWGQTTGIEGVGLNVIAYTSAHWPPYRDLTTNATTAIFNFGFYACYGGVGRVFGRSGPENVLLAVRLTTFMFVVAGALWLYLWIRRVLPPCNPVWRELLAFSIATLIVTGPFVGWWALTARPDGATLVWEMAGLAAAVAATRDDRISWAVASSLCLAGALSFKQTEVVALLSVIAAWLLARRYAFALVGVSAMIAVGVIGVWLGGPFYLQNALRAASAASYSGSNLLGQIPNTAVIGLPVFGAAALVAASGTSRTDHALPAYVAFLVCAAIGVAELARVGSSRNYLFPSYAGGAVLLIARLGALRVWTNRALIVLTAAMSVWLAVLLSYVVVPDRIGRVTLDVDRSSTEKLRSAIRTATAPTFIENNFEAVPWITGHAESESIDFCVYDNAVSTRIIPRSVEERVRAREYASVFVTGRLEPVVRSAGYRLVVAFPDGTGYFVRP
jgi:hypothetical protein